ncbi:MAG: hypothetical protein KKB82_03465, partial [Candidatus Omnitrophica bacterium]|nr:hypothetical protein [Candidatus Omnitrophota bacterium]
NMKYFNYCTGLKMINRNFEELFKGPARRPESKITQRDMDIASSAQAATEEVMLCIARYVHAKTDMKNLCLAGGVALNCVGNGRILNDGPFENIWIQPAASDAGSALGAALFTWHQYLGNKREADEKCDFQKASLLGPEFTNGQIKDFLEKNAIPHVWLTDEELPDKAADLLNDQSVIGWFQGKMEFGPRALGNRSILGDARSAQMQETINLKIKFRESFRPFAPTVLAELAPDYFELKQESPYMLLVAQVNRRICRELTKDEGNLDGLDRLQLVRSSVPAITHVDYSARVQTIKEKDNPRYYKMLKRFYEKYGCAVVINTSFNVRGEPIVCTPQDAYRCFMRTNMDYLMLGNFLLEKKEQKPLGKEKAWLREFDWD